MLVEDQKCNEQHFLDLVYFAKRFLVGISLNYGDCFV